MLKLYIVEVTQYGVGLSYTKKAYEVSARNEEEAEAKAWARAKQECIYPSKAEVVV